MSSPRTTLLARMALAFILAVGFAVPYGIGIGWLNVVRTEAARRQSDFAGTERLYVRFDGPPLVFRDQRRFDEHYYHTLDGEPATIKEGESPTWTIPLRARPDKEELQYANQAGWTGRVVARSDGANPATYWYFVVTDDSAQGRAHFAGYDSQTNALVGYITPKGFGMAPPTAADEFSIDGRNVQGRVLYRIYDDFGNEGMTPGKSMQYSVAFYTVANALRYPAWFVFLHAGGHFLRVDLRERTVTDALGVADVIDVGVFNRPLDEGTTPVKSGPQARLEYAVRRPDRIVLFNPADGSSSEYLLPADIRSEPFTFYPLRSGEALVDIEHPYPDATSRSQPHDLVWINPAGEVLRKKSLSLESRDVLSSPISDSLVIALALPVPALLGLSHPLYDPGTWGDSFRDLLANAWPALLLILIIATAFTIAADMWRRRYGLPRSVAWLAFVFLFGLPGFVGYLLHRRWPVRQVAPPPVRTGLEVFA